MKFLETRDLVCNRDISLNLQSSQITYIESISPKISTIHFATGGHVKVPLSRAQLVSAIEAANDSGPSMLMINATEPKSAPFNSNVFETQIQKTNPFIPGDPETDRRKPGTDRRSTAALEAPPKKPGDKDKAKKDEEK